ncbi:MAG: M56 family metallopeptidase [Lachnospiraceae bacterium]|jgi:beta-lactamase regulating signal transducer with metallopeptidase domain|nr:M56 family metallopeptidase [Lachnospiraceae bacterium]
MSLFHTMGFAGSVVILVYMLSYVYTKRHLPTVWHKVYLTITIALFLIPFPYFCMDYGAWVKKVLRVGKFLQGKGGQINNSGYLIFIYKNGVAACNELSYIVTFILILISIYLIFCMAGNYKKEHKKVLNCSNPSKMETDMIHMLGGNVKVKVYRCRGLSTPVATGLLNGNVILPDTDFTQDRLKDTLNHELIHIKVKDNLVRLLLLAVVFLNFYNPFVYYLWKRWSIVAEMYCDEKVLAGKNTQQIKDYANMVVDFAEGKYSARLPFMGLGKNAGEKELKERIKNMMKRRKKFGLLSKVVGTILIATGVFASSLTAAAYQSKDVAYLDVNNDADKVQSFFIEGAEQLQGQNNGYLNEIETYITAEEDVIFVDESGNVYYDNAGENGIQPYNTCTHTYVNGTQAVHYIYSDGHCKVDYYSGQRCSKCGKNIFGDHISTQTFDKCPH